MPGFGSFQKLCNMGLDLELPKGFSGPRLEFNDQNMYFSKKISCIYLFGKFTSDITKICVLFSDDELLFTILLRSLLI